MLLGYLLQDVLFVRDRAAARAKPHYSAGNVKG